MPAARKKVARKTTKATPTVDENKIYRCTCCGVETNKPENVFYKLPYSTTHQGNDARSHICTDCVKELFQKNEEEYSTEFATKVVCAELNVPYYRSVYESICRNYADFNFGYYIRQINNKQYKDHSFALTLANGELEVSKKKALEQADANAEGKWTVDERRAKNEVIRMMGYDPFEGYHPRDRKVLFSELNNYLNDEELLSDNYKISQVIQIINNNNQINQYDIGISKLDTKRDIDKIKTLNGLKKELVTSNEKIAKENGISVKSRGDQKAGKGTLTGLMRDMREKDLEEAEVNFYDQLRSENTRWAIDMSMRSMMENCAFDENDVNDIIEMQRSELSELQDKAADLEEDKRLLKVEEYELKERIQCLEAEVLKLGGNVDVGIG